MREIKFRGKSMQGDELIYGSLVITDDNTNNPMQQRLPRRRHQIMTYSAGDWNMGGWSLKDVYENTVGQFTGLHDKNGKEIYEGDIVECTYTSEAKCSLGHIHVDSRSEIEEVQYDINHCAFNIANLDKVFHYTGKTITISVIGNIHDNPELL